MGLPEALEWLMSRYGKTKVESISCGKCGKVLGTVLADCVAAFCSRKCLAEYILDTSLTELGLDEVSLKQPNGPTFNCFKDNATDLDVQPTLTVTLHGDS